MFESNKPVFLRDLNKNGNLTYTLKVPSESYSDAVLTFLDYDTMNRCLKDMVYGVALTNWELQEGRRSIILQINFEPVKQEEQEE